MIRVGFLLFAMMFLVAAGDHPEGSDEKHDAKTTSKMQGSSSLDDAVLRNRHVDDERYKRWDKQTEKAMGTICKGC